MDIGNDGNKRQQFLVKREHAQLIANFINKARLRFPKLKIGPAFIVKDHLVGKENHGITPDERGIVFLDPTFEDHREFWDAVADEADKHVKENNDNPSHFRWLRI